MGECFIFAHFCIPESAKDDLDNIEHNLKEAVKSMTEDDEGYEHFIEYCLGTDEEHTLKEAKERARDIIDDTFNSLNGSEVGWIQRKGEIMWITGGISWGGDPTEAWEHFNNFGMIPKSVLEMGQVSF